MALARSPDPDSLWRAAEKAQPAFLETLETLVNLDSGSTNPTGLAQVEAVLERRLRALGGEVVALPAAGSAAGRILQASFRGRGHSRILLMMHYDTVFGLGEAMRRPFRIEGNRLLGPGVVDPKGGLAIILHALELLHSLDYAEYGTLTVLFNPDEEKGSFGSREWIGKIAARQQVVLSYEPPDTEAVVLATNGINYLFLEVSGIAAHAGSAPEQGRNAVIELAHQLLQLRDLGDPALATTVHWTLVQGGERRNIIPAQAQAEGDMRYSHVAEIERVEKAASALVKNRLIPDTQTVFRLERGRPPLALNPATARLASLAQRLYAETGRRLETIQMRFGTDAGYAYQPGETAPAVLEGLGLPGGSLHTSREYGELDQIVPRLYLTARLILAVSAAETGTEE